MSTQPYLPLAWVFVEADGVASVLIMSVAVIKCFGQKLTWGKRFILAQNSRLQSMVTRRSRWPELKTFGHIVTVES